jgi:hypothetical protein
MSCKKFRSYLAAFVATFMMAVGVADLLAEDTPPAAAGQEAIPHDHHDHADHAGHAHDRELPTDPETAPGLLSEGQPAPSGDGPQAVFDTPTYEFGRVMAGDPVRHDFWFTNRGNQTLEITNVRPACGCTTAGTWDRVVEPGKTGKIPILLKTEQFNGPLQKNVRIGTNVPGQPEVTLWIKGDVWQPVEVQPPYVNFRAVNESEQHTETIKITNHLDDPIKIVSARSDNPVFRVDVAETETGQKFDVTVTAMPPFKSGSNAGTITIDTDSPRKPNISLKAMCYVPAAVEVTPQRVMLPGGVLTQSVERAVYVNNNKPSPLKVSDIVVNDERVTTQLIEDMQPGKRFRIVLNFPEGFSAPQGDTLRLTFKTDNPSMPNVGIPITSIQARPKVATTPQAPTHPGEIRQSIRSVQQPKQPTEPATKGEQQQETEKGTAGKTGG